MELRMTVHVPRRRPRPVDVVVAADEGATTADLRSALGEYLGMPVRSLLVGGRPIDDASVLGRPPLLDGVSVAVTGGPGGEGTRSCGPGTGGTAAGGAGDHPRPVLRVVCVGGPDAGRSAPLEPPGLDIGRSPHRGLDLEDPALSRTHLRLDVGSDGVRVVDLGSTNGVLVDGRPVDGAARIDTSSTVVAGASTLRLRRAPGPGPPLRHPGDGTVAVVPGRTTVVDPPDVVIEAPPPPPERQRAKVPWVAALAPLPVVAGMAFFLGPHLLVFAVVGPVAVLATTLADRVSGRRRGRRDAADHAAALTAARRLFDDVVAQERRIRQRRHPDPDEVLATAEQRLAGLWGAPDDMTVRLGLGTVPTCARWRAAGTDRPTDVDQVPVVVDLADCGGLAVLAPPRTARAVVGALVAQLVVRSPPSRLALRTPAVPPVTRHDPDGEPCGWLERLPHAAGSGRPVLVVEDAAAVDDVAGPFREVRDTGGVAIVAAARTEDLPDGCGALLEPVGGGRWALRTPTSTVGLVVDAVGPAWRDRLSRALAPLREDGGASSVPGRVRLPDLDARPLTPDGVLERWAHTTGPRALVGLAADGPFALDLAADGPHVLVGGTTGSGKSEFLRTLVTALALGSPATDVTVLLVDFKGGAAFGPCAGLPHVVGLVTDLDERLADRVLRSLRSELRRRERLLAEVGAADLDAYRRQPGDEVLPRLVVVVDELRTLVDELPDVVRELVRLAAQGRSLGIHLVLATQRPAGAVTPEVQANVNLRIAFRVRDRTDAVGVVDDPRPADLPSDVPGRAVARGGDGRLTEFQAALVAPGRGAGPPRVVVRPARATSERDPEDRADRTAETAAVVAVVAEAHRRLGAAPPRRPWLPPLPEEVDAEGLPAGAFALVDDPDAQRRVPLSWTPGTSLWRVVGRPRAGRSSALRALVHAATTTHPPHRLHVHVIGPADEHADLAALPHVGTVARADDSGAVRALVEHLTGATTTATGGSDPTVVTLLLVDDWERLVEHDDPHAPSPVSREVLRLLRDGGSGGLVAAVSGGRDLLRSQWSALGGRVLVLGDPDPLDAALLGLPNGARPTASVPGRALLAEDAREVQVVLPSASWLDTAIPDDVPGSARSAPTPWRYRPLPRWVDRRAAAERCGPDEPRSGLLLGLAGPTAEPWRWRPDRDGRRLLVAGPPGSGRTSALEALAGSASVAGRPAVLVRGLATDGDAPRAPEARWSVLGPDAVDDLVALRRERPDLVVLVDDADRLDDAAVLPVLHEILGLVDRDGGAVAVATSTASLRNRFRGLDVDVAAHRFAVLLDPDPSDGGVLGVRRLPSDPGAPPGRGLVVARGSVTPVQVLAPEGGRPGP